MPPRTTFSELSSPPVTGTAFLAEYADRLKSLFDAAAFPLTSVAGTGNAVTASLDPPLDPGGLVNGMKFTITWGAANTGAVTLAINGGTAVPVVDADNVALGASALASGRRSLIEYIGGAFRILSSAGGGAAGGGPTYQAFTASGTWNKPTGYDPDTLILVECWGGGGGGGRAPRSNNSGGGGGGGGAYAARLFRYADVPTSVSVSVGAGGTAGAAVGTAGGNGGTTTFGSLVSAPGGFGGPVSSGIGTVGAAGGGEIGPGGTSGGPTNNALSIYGGGGGGIGTNTAARRGGFAFYGGGGGGGAGVAALAGDSGLSAAGGNGGNAAIEPSSATAGTVPGGGGGGQGVATTLTSVGFAGAGARGECRISILG